MNTVIHFPFLCTWNHCEMTISEYVLCNYDVMQSTMRVNVYVNSPNIIYFNVTLYFINVSINNVCFK
jgi:hypothetical protein